jgi:hypothetical protein
VVEGGEAVRPEPLSDSDRCRADDTDVKIGVGVNRFGHAEKVFPVDRVAAKRCFGQAARWSGGYGANDDVRARSGRDPGAMPWKMWSSAVAGEGWRAGQTTLLKWKNGELSGSGDTSAEGFCP